MIVCLFLFWIILNGRFTLDWGMLQVIITGILLVGAVTLFAIKFLGYKLHYEILLWKKIPLILAYILLLTKEIICSSFNMIMLIIKKKPYNPIVVRFNPPLKNKLTRVILANSITLTPGTITADLTDDFFTVHCIDASFAENIESCSFVKLLERIEK